MPTHDGMAASSVMLVWPTGCMIPAEYVGEAFIVTSIKAAVENGYTIPENCRK